MPDGPDRVDRLGGLRELHADVAVRRGRAGRGQGRPPTLTPRASAGVTVTSTGLAVMLARPSVTGIAGRARDDVCDRVLRVREGLAVHRDDDVARGRARPAGPASGPRPARCSSPATCRLFVGTPKAKTAIRARTKAMRKCMADPAEPTMMPLAEGLLAVGPGLVLVGHVLEHGEPGDADVAPGRDGLDPVLGLAPPDRPQPGAEADEVLGDLHAGPLGGGEVAQLVQHHDRHQDGDEEQQVAQPGHQEDGR